MSQRLLLIHKTYLFSNFDCVETNGKNRKKIGEKMEKNERKIGKKIEKKIAKFF